MVFYNCRHTAFWWADEAAGVGQWMSSKFHHLSPRGPDYTIPMHIFIIPVEEQIPGYPAVRCSHELLTIDGL